LTPINTSRNAATTKSADPDNSAVFFPPLSSRHFSRFPRKCRLQLPSSIRGRLDLHTPEGAELPLAPLPVRVLRPVAAEHRPRWDRHIRRLKRPPAARPSDDRRSTSIRRQTTNNRTVRNDIRRDANVRLPRTGVRDRPSGFDHGQSVVLRQQPFRLVGLQDVPAQPQHAVQVHSLDGRRRPQDARLLSVPSAARPAPLQPVFYLFVVPPLPTAALKQKSTPKKWKSSGFWM
jgi:hypothetical protein